MSDDEPDGHWLTKVELAAARNISLASADRLIRRRKWRRQKGNDGRVRVLMPADIASDTSSDKPEDNRENERLIAQLQERIAGLEGQILGLTEAHSAEIDRLKQTHREEVERLHQLLSFHRAPIQRQWWRPIWRRRRGG